MREFWRKLRRRKRRDDLAERLHEELDFHVEMKVRESGQEISQARREVGSAPRILEQADDVWSLGLLEEIVSDLRYAVRALAKSPAFFLLAAAGAGFGVAAITAVLSVADTVLIRPMPYRDSDRLVVVSDQLLKIGLPRFPVTVANYLDYAAQNQVFDDIAAFEPRAMTVVTGDRAERVSGMLASSNFLSLLGGSVEHGRWILPEENHAGQTDVAVVSLRFWQTHLLADPNAIGKLIRIDEAPYAVVGVVKEPFGFRLAGEAPDLWLPASLDLDTARNTGTLQLIARLKRGVTPAEAQAQMQSIAAGLKQRYRTGMGPRGEDAGYAIAVVPLREELYGSARSTLYALVGASGILLLLGLANTAILWLGRAAARKREAAVRLALGASRRRVGQQLVMEALLPSLAGGALALALALLALDALNAARLGEFATMDRFAVNYRVFSFAMLLSIAAGVLFGALPVRSLFRSGAERQSLAQDRGGIGERSDSRARPWLIAIQTGLSCALLVPALLLVESLVALERVNPGFRTRDLLTARVTLPASKYRTPDQIAAYYQGLERELNASAGAGRVALASALPLSFGAGGDPFSIEGRAWGASGTAPQFAHPITVGAEYFSVMQIPVLAGRGFDGRDFSETTDRAIVNETLAKAFWPNESALEKRIMMGAPRPGATWKEIVGIVRDVHTSDLSRAPLPQIYRPFPQSPTRTMALIVESGEAGGVMAADLARVLRAADPNVPPYQVKTMEQHVTSTLDRPRFRTQLFAAYGLLAFALAAFGVYSLSLYSGIRRRREFALRSALGATGRRLLGTILTGTMRPAVMGVTVGLAIAYAIARAISTFLYGTTASGAAAYLLAGCLALAVAALASVLGGRCAIQADPAEVLRGE